MFDGTAVAQSIIVFSHAEQNRFALIPLGLQYQKCTLIKYDYFYSENKDNLEYYAIPRNLFLDQSVIHVFGVDPFCLDRFFFFFFFPVVPRVPF
jgi:hypothetical protein